MAAEGYFTIRVYLHRQKDKNVIAHINALPPIMRQTYIREALAHYMDHPLRDNRPEPSRSEHRKTAPATFKPLSEDSNEA